MNIKNIIIGLFICLLTACGSVNKTTISKFSLGWNGYGLNWLSISGGRTKAPVNDDSNSAEALEKMAQVIKANKTVVDAGDVSVNKSTSSQ